MRVLALDISTKTGWALFEEDKLIGKGLLKEARNGKEDVYPLSYWYRADSVASSISEIIRHYKPDVVVVEETNGGSRAGRYSQKLLEYLHCALLGYFVTYMYAEELITPLTVEIKYISTSEWRKTLGLHLSKDQKKSNQKLSKAKSQANQKGLILDKKALKIKGKITWKHLSVQYANEVFGLSLKQKDNDIADAINIGLAYLKGAKICDGK